MLSESKSVVEKLSVIETPAFPCGGTAFHVGDSLARTRVRKWSSHFGEESYFSFFLIPTIVFSAISM